MPGPTDTPAAGSRLGILAWAAAFLAVAAAMFAIGAQHSAKAAFVGAPMGLMRLADAPTIGGESKALRKVHPATKDGPVAMMPWWIIFSEIISITRFPCSPV